ncbi:MULTISPECIES: FKBP-type peptidyl-prolyl cis-trans isomerase N-terminal domain-containing protein [unclassified Francisella]|uniref:FKBP-type peptidyl-prolyl cis-trans isomerase N-terminal domain-containing protein n=1 Tax=unclassified Francisella TaxID=2610885 RepID=UPI002E2F405A|nr:MULTISPECIES: FKBP-type peptidyl-prolyl cis-trans isomerase N-terminal domain-containing protein [unclassified Francisella]MED7820266.1 FKBP-type peptidyl-prolyl cis-trans isomerase N-terminal domain-containing protein [Francisella sp. 19S2-4]MED7831101.1 FKBP-type peptidyl-prolyl cis-trans isomerase N-terminal domain-containing protein [Francisella sp. 19S2-10]
MNLKKIVAITSCSLIGLTVNAYSDTKPTGITVGPQASYTVGYQIGSGIANQNFGIDNSEAAKGFEDALKGNQPKISKEQMQKDMEILKNKLAKKQIDIAKQNEINSEKLINEISKIDGITKVNDGVYYQVIEKGDGKKPNADSKVTIAYNGTTPAVAYEKDNEKALNAIKQGKLIGSSFDSSEGVSFPLTNLIKCWKDAIPQIPTGSTVILYCAPDTAYGTRAPAAIGPNQVLSFKITLKSFS